MTFSANNSVLQNLLVSQENKGMHVTSMFVHFVGMGKKYYIQWGIEIDPFRCTSLQFQMNRFKRILDESIIPKEN